MAPFRRKFSGVEWPDNACKLSCAGGGSGSKSAVGDGGCSEVTSDASSSSSATDMNNKGEHLCPREYLSSQWKHSPFSRWTASSAGVSRLKGMEGAEVHEGLGNNGEVALVARDCEAVVVTVVVGERCVGGRCALRNFSSCKRAYVTA